MRPTRKLSRPQRYAVSSVFAFAAHWSLACALPAGTPSNTEAEPALVWLEAATLATGTTAGLPAQDAAIASTLAAQAPSAGRTQVRRGRNVSRLARANESPKTVSSSAVLAPLTPEAALELAGPMREVHEAGVLQGSTNGQTAGAVGGASGVAPGSAAGMPMFGAPGDGALVHGPILRAAKGCAGYFPADARAGHGEVEIDVTVDAGGHARESHVLNEQPFGQGFGVAARGCVRTLSFAPAVDSSGAAVAGHAKLRLRFDRPFTT